MSQKTIVVVGVGEGLGKAIAKAFGKKNFKVCMIARNTKKLDTFKQEFEKEGIQAFIYEADCGKPHTLKMAFEKILKDCGSIEILVYNAALNGAQYCGLATSFDNEDFIKHFQVNVASALVCAKFVAENQAKNEAIIFTGGIFGDTPMKEYTGISVGKAALKALGKTLSDELKDKGIFVGLVTITQVIAPNTSHSPELIAQKYIQMYEKRDKFEYVH